MLYAIALTLLAAAAVATVIDERPVRQGLVRMQELHAERRRKRRRRRSQRYWQARRRREAQGRRFRYPWEPDRP